MNKGHKTQCGCILQWLEGLYRAAILMRICIPAQQPDGIMKGLKWGHFKSHFLSVFFFLFWNWANFVVSFSNNDFVKRLIKLEKFFTLEWSLICYLPEYLSWESCESCILTISTWIISIFCKNVLVKSNSS